MEQNTATSDDTNNLNAKKRKNSGNKCNICGNISTAASYFRIPGCHQRRAEWLNCLNLSQHDVMLPSFRVCSTHFCEEDMKFNVSQRKRTLKNNAKPSMNLDQPPKKRIRKNESHWCFLCGKRDGEGNRCYFKFPEDPVLFSRWAEFCQSAEEFIFPSYRLCSDHFSHTDIQGSMEFGKSRKLKGDAVPTIREAQSKENLNSSPEGSPECPDDSSIEIEPEIVLGVGDESLEVVIVDQLDELELNCSSTPSAEGTFSSSQSEITSTSAEVSPTETVGSGTNNTPSTPTSGFRVPKYVGQIKSPHLSTPRRAKACFLAVRRVLIKKKKETENLRQNLRRAHKKIKTLKDLVKHLKKQNFISEQARIKLM